MGAETFESWGRGESAKAVFDALVKQAQYDHGHGGYSGTIAEKRDFTEIAVPDGTDPVAFARKLVEDGDARVDDKWGPAGCVKLGPGEWLFFGWASS